MNYGIGYGKPQKSSVPSFITLSLFFGGGMLILGVILTSFINLNQ